jgi:glycosyltransferase involved in cell wall biosynthesis
MSSPSDGTATVQHPVTPATTATRPSHRYIYLAGPCTPMGGGMYKVCDYLVQSQPQGAAEPVLRLLETRGPGRAIGTLVHLPKAMAAVVRGRLGGRLAGVHVNVAERLSLIRKAALMLTCKLAGVPVVLHLHAAQLHHTYRAMGAIGQRLVRWMFSLPDSCIVLGQGAADFVTRELHVPADQVEIVINGVPDPRLRPAAGRKGDVPRILFLGNLSERKGVSDLLRALAQPALAGVPFQLSLAGGGDVAHYTALAQSLGVADRVSFEGWAGPEAVSRLLAQADVLVLPSYDEGLPLAILEGLAHALPVVCTPVGEIPHVLTDGVDARFVQPGDSPGIASALAQILRDASLSEHLGRNARAVYEQRFSLTHFAASIARIHQRHFGTSALPSSPSPADSRP